MSRKPATYCLLVFLFSFFSFGSSTQTGILTREEILQNFPDWEVVVASYFPNPEAVKGLRFIGYPVQIEIFLGTWCPDSKQHVSEFFKILDLVENPNLIPVYIDLPRNKNSQEELAKGKNIEKVPTFIVTINDQEKGRIIEHPVKSLEEDLLDIITESR